MIASKDFRAALSIRVLISVICGISLAGCSDPQADQRARLCKGAGVTGAALKTCRNSDEGYNSVMKPIRARQERKEIAEFNEALHALPSRTIPRDQYELTSLEKFNREHRDLDLIEESKMSQHPLFGKRFRVNGVVRYHSVNFKNELPERVSLEAEDINDPKKTWSVDTDLESLAREERAFIRSQCEYLFDGCHGEFFGVIGIVRRGELLQSLGLQIEYIEVIPREHNKPS